MSDLTESELKKWAILEDDYSDRMREYNKKSKAISELDNPIESTVDRNNYTIIRNLTTPYAKLKQTTWAAYESA